MITISLLFVTFIRACKLLVSPILLENKLPSMIKRFAHPYLALRISIQFFHRIFSIVEKSLPKRKRKKKRNRFAPLPRRTEPIDASIIQHKKKESRNEGTISCPLIRKHSGDYWPEREGGTKETSRSRRFARSLPTPRCGGTRFYGGDAASFHRCPQLRPYRGNSSIAEERLMTRSDSLIRLHSRW